MARNIRPTPGLNPCSSVSICGLLPLSAQSLRLRFCRTSFWFGRPVQESGPKTQERKSDVPVNRTYPNEPPGGAKMEACESTTYKSQNRTPVRQAILGSELGTQNPRLRTQDSRLASFKNGLWNLELIWSLELSSNS